MRPFETDFGPLFRDVETVAVATILAIRTITIEKIFAVCQPLKRRHESIEIMIISASCCAKILKRMVAYRDTRALLPLFCLENSIENKKMTHSFNRECRL